ncbi:MAG: phosphotransferase [Bacteroidota bacterium]
MTTYPLAWEDPGWRTEAQEWIRSQLSGAGLRLNGQIEQPHIHPASTVMRVPTDGGLFYFKATAPYLRHEAALTAYLTRFRPVLFPRLLAVEPGRGWMLMENAGTPLRQYIRSEKSFGRWGEIMPLYVNLQKDLAPYTEDLLGLGILDRRLSRLPALFEELVADQPSMLLGQPDGLTPGEYEQLKRSVPEFERMCERLASAGIPETIHHDDFHDGNIFVRDGRVLFTDWAESAVAHPFFSLVVMLRGAGNSLEAFSGTEEEAGPDTPEIIGLRNLYLQHWTSHASLGELQSLARIAERSLGYVNRALTWHLVVSNMPPPLPAEYAAAIPGYLQEFLHA